MSELKGVAEKRVWERGFEVRGSKDTLKNFLHTKIEFMSMWTAQGKVSTTTATSKCFNFKGGKFLRHYKICWKGGKTCGIVGTLSKSYAWETMRYFPQKMFSHLAYLKKSLIVIRILDITAGSLML